MRTSIDAQTDIASGPVCKDVQGYNSMMNKCREGKGGRTGEEGNNVDLDRREALKG